MIHVIGNVKLAISAKRIVVEMMPRIRAIAQKAAAASLGTEIDEVELVAARISRGEDLAG